MKKYDIVERALAHACKWMRDNPPGDLDNYTEGQLFALTHSKEDPDGLEYVKYFLLEAKKELEKEEKELIRSLEEFLHQ